MRIAFSWLGVVAHAFHGSFLELEDLQKVSCSPTTELFHSPFLPIAMREAASREQRDAVPAPSRKP